MGLNIHVYWLKKDSPDFQNPPFEWDSCRHSGDSDFVSNNVIKHVYHERDARDDDYILWRPEDFGLAREWITTNIQPEGNRERLLKLMNDLEANADCWLFSSY